MAFGADHTLGMGIDSSLAIIVNGSAGYSIGFSQFVGCDNDSPFRSGQEGETGKMVFVAKSHSHHPSE